VNLSSLDYSNYSANTKSIDMDEHCVHVEGIKRDVKIEEERHVKVEDEHRRRGKTKAVDKEEEINEGPFRVNKEEALQLGYKDNVFLRNYEIGCQRILDGIKKMQCAPR
jgi:hypothetical protein